MNKIYKIRKNDIILMASFIIIAIIAIGAYTLTNKASDKGSYVQIMVDGTLYKELPLNKDTKISIKGKGGKNILQIKNGYADIIDADCPDKLCVKQKKIHYSGETLVCLPHKVVVTIISDKKSKLDGIAS